MLVEAVSVLHLQLHKELDDECGDPCGQDGPSVGILLMLCVLRTRVSSLDGLLGLGLDGRLTGAQDFAFCCFLRDLNSEISSLPTESPE